MGIAGGVKRDGTVVKWQQLEQEAKMKKWRRESDGELEGNGDQTLARYIFLHSSNNIIRTITSLGSPSTIISAPFHSFWFQLIRFDWARFDSIRFLCFFFDWLAAQLRWILLQIGRHDDDSMGCMKASWLVGWMKLIWNVSRVRFELELEVRRGEIRQRQSWVESSWFVKISLNLNGKQSRKISLRRLDAS